MSRPGTGHAYRRTMGTTSAGRGDVDPERPDGSRPPRRVGLTLGGTADTAGTAGTAGAALGAAFVVTAKVRRDRPLHPVGVVSTGQLAITPTGHSGSPLLDEPGEHDCLVRASWAMGVGPGSRDIEGLAIRLWHPGVGDARGTCRAGRRHGARHGARR